MLPPVGAGLAPGAGPAHAGAVSRSREALPVLHLDDDLVAVDKPSGMLVHRTGLDAGETRFVVQTLRDQLGRRVYPVHRLDKGASGVLVLARHEEAAAALGASVRERRMRRTYVAVVRGRPPEEGRIDHPLRRIVDPAEDRPRGRDGRAAAKDTHLPAATAFRRLATVELPYRVDRYPTSRYSLLELTPENGRRHQVRRHLDHASHPVLGDSTYGKGRHNRLFAARFGVSRLLLACVEVRVPHPRDGSPLVVRAPLATDFARVVAALGWTGALPEAWR
jgi:tRNA pseudouridine65 synthase